MPKLVFNDLEIGVTPDGQDAGDALKVEYTLRNGLDALHRFQQRPENIPFAADRTVLIHGAGTPLQLYAIARASLDFKNGNNDKADWPVFTFELDVPGAGGRRAVRTTKLTRNIIEKWSFEWARRGAVTERLTGRSYEIEVESTVDDAELMTLQCHPD